MSISKVTEREGHCGICGGWKELIAYDEELPEDERYLCAECKPADVFADKFLNVPALHLARPTA